mgnify:CR=1 FL=1
MSAFKAIAAMSLNRVIGNGLEIPWHIPEDFKWFKETTMSQVLVMGRRTFDSIGKALPGRETMVLTRGDFSHPDVTVIQSLDEVAPRLEGRTAFIAGGAQVRDGHLWQRRSPTLRVHSPSLDQCPLLVGLVFRMLRDQSRFFD